IYLNLARAYMNQGQFQSARNDARKALQYQSDWGRPYILIADVYAKTIRKCTANRDLKKTDKAVYWLVLDNLNKAKRVATSPSVKSTAESQLKTYSQYTPTTQDIFFMQGQGWK